MTNIPQLIKQAREDSGLTQAQLADSIFANRSHISQIEAGKKGVSIGQLERIMASMGKKLVISYEDAR